MSDEDDAGSEAGPYSMTEEILAERLRKHDYGRISTQLYAAFLACLSAMSFGTALGWSCPITYELYKGDDALSRKNFAWLAGMVPLGCATGFISWSYAMKNVGPKKALQIQAPFYILNWWLVSMEAIDVTLASRFFLGHFGIAHVVCGECFLNETVHRRLAQYFMIAVHFSTLGGVLLMHSLGFTLTKLHLTVFCAVIPMLHFLLLFFVPESPVYLYKNGEKVAQDALTWYRGKKNIYMDLRKIRRDYESKKLDPEAYKYMMFSKVVIKALFRIITLIFLQISSGYYVFLFFSIKIWNNEETVISPLADSALIALSLCVSKLIWNIFYIKITPKIRKMLISSCFLVALQLTLLSTYTALHHFKIHISHDNHWIPFLLVAAAVFFGDMGINYYPKLLTYDYMPYQVLKLSNSIVQVVFWFLIFLNVFSFAALHLICPSFIVFGTMAFLLYLGTLFCYFLVVETKGRSLVQIQIEIGGNPVGNRAALYARTEVRPLV